MLYCQQCGSKLTENEKYCFVCGALLNENEANTEIQNDNSVPKCFTIFGKIGFILGIITIAICLIPGWNIVCFDIGPIGIVFSCLGKKDPTLKNKTKAGFILSIVGFVVGLIINVIAFIIFINIFIIILSNRNSNVS